MRIIFYVTFPIGFIFALNGYSLGMSSYFATTNLGTGLVAWGNMSVVVLFIAVYFAFAFFVIGKASGDSETLREYLKEITCVKEPDKANGAMIFFVIIPIAVGVHSFLLSLIGFRYGYVAQPGIKAAVAAFGMSVGLDFILMSIKALLKRFSTNWYKAPSGLERPSSFS